MQTKVTLGKLGENIAASYLSKKGFIIIARNFRVHYGEIDLVALDRGVLVFIEVKTRIGRSFGVPEEAVTPKKLKEVIKTAHYFKSLHPELPQSMRIDVLALELNGQNDIISLRHIPNVSQ